MTVHWYCSNFWYEQVFPHKALPRLWLQVNQHKPDVTVNFVCPPDWDVGCPDIWVNSILGVWICLGEINIWNGRLNKAHCPPQHGWASSNLLKAWIEQNTEQERICSLCLMIFELGHWSSPNFGLTLRLELISPALLELSLQILGLLSLHNHASQFLITNLSLSFSLYMVYILLILFLWRTLILILWKMEPGGTEF